MDPMLMWTIVAIVIAAAIAAGVWFSYNKRRTEQLRQRFGPEYDRAIHDEGNVRKAEAALAERARRVEKLQIHPLSPGDATRFSAEWRRIQALFVDDPTRAVTDADRLVGEVMSMRGYPTGDFEQRVADISVDHPDVVMNYRAARDIALQRERGEASTEDLRQAMVHYRALFRDLLQTAVAEPVRDEVHEAPPAR